MGLLQIAHGLDQTERHNDCKNDRPPNLTQNIPLPNDLKSPISRSPTFVTQKGKFVYWMCYVKPVVLSDCSFELAQAE